MKHIHIHFYRMTGVLAWLIRLWTGSRYAHCAIEFENGATLWVATSGVTMLDSRIKQDASVKLVVTDTQYSTAYHMALAMSGRQYDWQGIAGQAIGICTENPKEWFCSEAAAKILQSIGHTLPHPSEWYSPERLARALGL